MIPGAVVLVARHGKIAYFKSFGMRDQESASPMKKDSIFRIASMTKPITKVGIMILHEQGRFFLSDPISKYIPELGNLKVGVESIDSATGQTTFTTVPSKRDIRIEDLLSHTSGFCHRTVL
jgi:CubicO group peptidase (beta-lactamase class C family)